MQSSANCSAAHHPGFQIHADAGHFPFDISATLRVQALALDAAPNGVGELVAALPNLKEHAVAHGVMAVCSGSGSGSGINNNTKPSFIKEEHTFLGAETRS
jgi:hypothetical protein